MKHSIMTVIALLSSAACGGDVGTSRTGHPGDAGVSGGTGISGGASAGGAATGAAPNSGGASGSGGGVPSGGRSESGGMGGGGIPSSGGSAGGCATPCGGGAVLDCCAGACVNKSNDPHHCGACGAACPSSTPLCLQGKCVVPACGDSTVPDAAPPVCAGGTACCGASCCTANEICCNVERGGPARLGGPAIGCFDPSKSGGTCPIGCPLCVCASPDTPIATPTGERAIATLAVGDIVYSMDHGELNAVPIAMVHQNPARDHRVLHIELEGGAVLEISAPHPTADGRHFGDLRRGDLLDGKRILTATVIPYSYAFTYDILPASDSGTYVAGGALIGSTLGGSAFSLAAGQLGGGTP